MEYAQIEWNNGVPASAAYDDIYYSTADGLAETEHVFLAHNDVRNRWQRTDPFVILETGFGSGLNFCATLHAWKASGGAADLHFFSIEKHPFHPADLQRAARQWPQLAAEYAQLLDAYPAPLRGMHCVSFEGGCVKLYLCLDDIEAALARLDIQADAIYLDGFAPSRNPRMWSRGVAAQLARLSASDATFSTYTAAGDVRRGFTQAGFAVRKVAGFGSKRDMLAGAMVARAGFRREQPWYAPPAGTIHLRECVIIGAGLAGLATAYALSRRGWKITLVDRHAQVAREASGNPAGLLAPRLAREYSEDARFHALAALYAARRLAVLQRSTAAQQPFWFPTGLLSFGRDEGEDRPCVSGEYPHAFLQHVDAARAGELAGVPLERGGLHLPMAGYVRVDLLCRSLLALCGNALVYQRLAVRAIRRERDAWILDGGVREIAAPALVLANGVHASAYDATAWLPLASSRGQISGFAPAARAGLQCPLSGRRYITPAVDGLCTVGASYARNAGCDGSESPDPGVHLENYRALAHMLGEDAVRGVIRQPANGGRGPGRVACRCTTPDRAPVVGAVPDAEAYRCDYADLRHGRNRVYPDARYRENLFVTSGHGSRGLTTCLLGGEVVAAMMSGEPLPVDRPMAEWMHPGRFLVRELKRRSPG